MAALKEFYGEKLRLARLVNGLGQADLADKLNISRQYIHSLEVDAKTPSEELVPALALSLNVLPEFFYIPIRNQVKEEQCHFRQLRKTPQSITSQVIAHGTVFELLVSYLDSVLGLPPLNFPHIEVRNEEDIETAAETCRKHWGLGLGPISNMCRVLENAGAVITYFDGLSDKVDALSINRPRHIVVRNTLKESPARLRFDLAHECGHLVMHDGIETGDKFTEDQAHRFASAFLMPRKSFVEEFPIPSTRIDWIAIYDLKLRWRTSVAAIIRRAKDLMLIDEAQYYWANQYLGKTGQKKNEKYDERLALEKPELIQNAIKVWLDTYGKQPAELAALIGITPKFLSKISGVTFNQIINNESPNNVVSLANYAQK